MGLSLDIYLRAAPATAVTRPASDSNSVSVLVYKARRIAIDQSKHASVTRARVGLHEVGGGNSKEGCRGKEREASACAQRPFPLLPRNTRAGNGQPGAAMERRGIRAFPLLRNSRAGRREVGGGRVQGRGGVSGLLECPERSGQAMCRSLASLQPLGGYWRDWGRESGATAARDRGAIARGVRGQGRAARPAPLAAPAPIWRLQGERGEVCALARVEGESWRVGGLATDGRGGKGGLAMALQGLGKRRQAARACRAMKGRGTGGGFYSGLIKQDESQVRGAPQLGGHQSTHRRRRGRERGRRWRGRPWGGAAQRRRGGQTQGETQQQQGGRERERGEVPAGQEPRCWSPLTHPSLPHGLHELIRPQYVKE